MSPRVRYLGYAYLVEAGVGDGFTMNVRAFPEGDPGILFADPANFGYGCRPTLTIGRPVITGGQIVQSFAVSPETHVVATGDF